MAVDYFHFLVVTGPPPAVDDFVHRIALVVTRRIAGVSVQQTVPFSFESLCAMAGLKKEDAPAEPLDMTRWPIVRRGRLAEVRYRFHTRSVDLHPYLKRLSKHVPRLTFALVTRCLDDNDFAPFTIRGGTLRGKWLGGEWGTPFYERAARKFKMTLDEVYEDDDVEEVAEWWMTHAAVHIATGTNRRYEWRSGRVYRDLDDERMNAMRDLGHAMRMMAMEGEKERARATARKRRRSS